MICKAGPTLALWPRSGEACMHALLMSLKRITVGFPPDLGLDFPLIRVLSCIALFLACIVSCPSFIPNKQKQTSIIWGSPRTCLIPHGFSVSPEPVTLNHSLVHSGCLHNALGDVPAGRWARSTLRHNHSREPPCQAMPQLIKNCICRIVWADGSKGQPSCKSATMAKPKGHTHTRYNSFGTWVILAKAL